MLVMWLCAGLALVLALCILTLLGGRPLRPGRNTAHPQISRRLLRQLRRATRSSTVSRSEKTLRREAPLLMSHLTRLRRTCRRLPPLPASGDGEPRLMDLARDAADAEAFDAWALLHLLREEAPPPGSLEVTAFPLLVAAAQCQRFGAVMKIIAADAREIRAAIRLARQLRRRSGTTKKLAKTTLNSIGLAALLEELQSSGELLRQVREWLLSRNISPDTLAECYAARQARLTEEIRRTLVCLDALAQPDWPDLCQEADPLHALLTQDPSGVYSRMDPASRLQLRTRAARLSQVAHIPEAALVGHALQLCRESAPQSPEQSVSYWLSSPDGLSQLHRSLGTKRGGLYFRLFLRREGLERAFLTCFGLGCGLLFLQARQPVFMLPFYLLAVGGISRFILRCFPPDALPSIAEEPADCHVRTLILLHVPLRDHEDVHPAVRQLLELRQLFGDAQADFLLMTDFVPCMTAVSGQDAFLMKSVSAALQAHGPDERLLVIHRGRTWDSRMHLYCARWGLCGALLDVCRLVAQGEHEDPIAFSTHLPAAFERKYAYILPVPSGTQPAPDLLQRLQRIIAHPQCLRYPDVRQPRGYSLLLPEETPLFMGAGLLRPDAYLEETDGLPLHEDSLALCGILAGQAVVPGAHLLLPPPASVWVDLYHRSLSAWRSLPWQLPWLQSPAGLIGNPMHAGGRFQLRELLRATLTPLGQLVLLLWAVLTQRWLLLLTALGSAALSGSRLRQPLRHYLTAFSLLPTRMVVCLVAILQLLRRKAAAPPDWTVVQLWSQLLAATLVGGLGFVFARFVLPCLALSALFALFPLTRGQPGASVPQ